MQHYRPSTLLQTITRRVMISTGRASPGAGAHHTNLSISEHKLATLDLDSCRPVNATFEIFQGLQTRTR